MHYTDTQQVQPQNYFELWVINFGIPYMKQKI
jgi:hypothetical protein